MCSAYDAMLSRIIAAFAHWRIRNLGNGMCENGSGGGWKVVLYNAILGQRFTTVNHSNLNWSTIKLAAVNFQLVVENREWPKFSARPSELQLRFGVGNKQKRYQRASV